MIHRIYLLKFNENKNSMEIGMKNGIMELQTNPSMNKEQNNERCCNMMNARCEQ